MEQYWPWIQDHILAIVAVGLTLVLIYHFLIERDTGVKLSKRYRNSIFEAQSKMFLNATHHLISGHRDLAIKEFQNAVDLNRESIDTYFALGDLFRNNGEIEKAIGIHRSLIARESTSEATRLRALKELAVDFDKGGFIDKAIETYKDVLKINRDQHEVISALCRIYEDIEDWDQAYSYRIMLSKSAHENQAETISHILVQKAKIHFEKGNFTKAAEDLEDAFRYAPSVSAKILRLKLFLMRGNLEESKALLLELLKEHPLYASFLFLSLGESYQADERLKSEYLERMNHLKNYFLQIDDGELLTSPSVILSKVRLLREHGETEQAYLLLTTWMSEKHSHNEVLKIEYIKLLIELEKKDEALKASHDFLESLHKSLTRHFCSQCGFNSDDIFWRCPQCREWETIQFRWKVS